MNMKLIRILQFLGIVVICGIFIGTALEMKRDHPTEWSLSGRTNSTDGGGIDGSYFEYPDEPDAAKGTKYVLANGFQDNSPQTIADRLRAWDMETARIPGSPLNKMTNMTRHTSTRVPPNAGLWHVYSDVIGSDQVDPPLPKALAYRKYLVLNVYFPGEEKAVWEITGPLQGTLYLPLKHLLSTCAMYPDPDHPNIRPELEVPVIVATDESGKNVIQWKPLITNVDTKDQGVQVFTGDPKEDQYFDKKFNSP